MRILLSLPAVGGRLGVRTTLQTTLDRPYRSHVALSSHALWQKKSEKRASKEEREPIAHGDDDDDDDDDRRPARSNLGLLSHDEGDGGHRVKVKGGETTRGGGGCR